MIVKFKRLYTTAEVPSYAKPGDAGLDLTCTTVCVTKQYYEYGTGLATEIPEGFVGLLFPRSSVSKTQQTLANCVGVIDAGYRGEIKLRYYVNGGTPYRIGDKIGQLIIMPYPYIEPVLVDDLSDTERGEGGFGSSGE